MILLYFCFIGFPLLGLILKIKNKEFDEPKLFIWTIVWIVACTIFWTYMDWWNWDGGKGLYDPDWIRK